MKGGTWLEDQDQDELPLFLQTKGPRISTWSVSVPKGVVASRCRGTSRDLQAFARRFELQPRSNICDQDLVFLSIFPVLKTCCLACVPSGTCGRQVQEVQVDHGITRIDQSQPMATRTEALRQALDHCAGVLACLNLPLLSAEQLRKAKFNKAEVGSLTLAISFL